MLKEKGRRICFVFLAAVCDFSSLWFPSEIEVHCRSLGGAVFASEWIFEIILHFIACILS